jgi:hypothetical protein
MISNSDPPLCKLVPGWLLGGHLGFMIEDDELFDIVHGINHGEYAVTSSTSWGGEWPC